MSKEKIKPEGRGNLFTTKLVHLFWKMIMVTNVIAISPMYPRSDCNFFPYKDSLKSQSSDYNKDSKQFLERAFMKVINSNQISHTPSALTDHC
jgi:hypothetical protein